MRSGSATPRPDILERRGFEVLLAGDGPEALAKLGQKPEVVILDIKMPGMDGLEVLGKIRAQDRQLPVIMLTGHGSEMAAQEALKQGAFDFLAKPCDIDVLSQKVNEACKASHPPGEHPESRVAEVMVPLEEYTIVSPQATVAETMIKMRESFFAKAATDSIMETGHRSVLVTDNGGKVRGILAILDLLKAIMPSYLSAPKPTLADSIVYSPMFWAGLFTRSIRELGPKKISEIMSPAPPVISVDATLMDRGL